MRMRQTMTPTVTHQNVIGLLELEELAIDITHT